MAGLAGDADEGVLAVGAADAVFEAAKGLICSQYFFKAGEGRISETWYPYGADGPAVQPGKRPW